MVIIMCPQKASRTDRAPASRYPMGGCGDLLKYLGATEIPIKRRLSSRQSFAPNDPTGTRAPQLQQDRQESSAGN